MGAVAVKYKGHMAESEAPGAVDIPEACSSAATGIGLTPSTLSLRNVESLLLTAQQQQLRHLRRLQQMRRQAEISAAMQVAWQEKQEAEEQRRAAREAEAKEAQARRLEHHRNVETRNAAAQEAAGRTRDMWRSALVGKLEAAKQRTSARLEARRRRIYANHEAQLDARRAALEEKQAQEQRHLQQRQELRLIQDEIRREEEALWAVRRDELRQRAESEQAARSSYYGLRAQERDRQLAERKQELEAQRAAHAEEARQRASYNQQRAAGADAAERAKRDRLAAKLQGKMAKVDAIMAQRTALVKEVQRVQAGMAAQEERMKAALQTMAVWGLPSWERPGARTSSACTHHTGKWHLPAELVDTTAALQSAILDSPTRSATAAAPGGRLGGSGLSSPSQRPDSACGLLAET
ncbi:hypothetical protein MNEG_9264, partial [Monoraphidium neglectum]